ncbi:MAG: hypothetical protein Unbinned200contig1000_68 [Prokaryotic dsDNA virus sp.]|jgi:hypothetical protein|nr:MAG: hypothetical protein Unbinned200contig1000_68 [Prokaryotic dsDNA virus sp.]|tara:strand:+ start:7583 stop:7750 length:168 start_codon:yes stop_codon:yes gene_type:complete
MEIKVKEIENSTKWGVYSKYETNFGGAAWNYIKEFDTKEEAIAFRQGYIAGMKCR